MQMLSSRPAARPFSGAGVRPKSAVAVQHRAQQLRVRAAETEEPAPDAFEDAEDGARGRRGVEKGMELKHFLPLPKPAHLVYVKPTVAVVAGVASRSSVGLKMTAGDQQLERYVIEYYARSVK